MTIAETLKERLAQPKESLVYALVFLFPIAGVSVRSWFSGIFTLLVLIALWELARGRWRVSLHRDEKIWLWLCAGFFLSFVVSSLINGWGDNQTRHLEVDIRYLFVVPLYLMLRRYPQAWRCLLAGVLVAAPVLGAQALYDVHIAGLDRAQGPYSPNLLGPVAALVAVWILASWHLWDRVRWLLPLLVLSAVTAVAMSGSRGAYLGLVVMVMVWALLYLRSKWRYAALAVIVLVPLLGYLTIPAVEQRVDHAVNEISVYLEQRDEMGDQPIGTAVRFEMWHAGWLVFREKPLFGAGRGNYEEAVRPYIEAGLLHPDVGDHAHAHNIYVDVLMSRGSIGLVIFLGMLFYPIYWIARTFHQSPETAIFGLLHVTGFALFSLTDASTFIKGNFVAIYLLCATVFFVWHASVTGRIVHGTPERQ